MKSSTIIDANEAVASVAYQLSDIVAIYPITPSSPMGEWADLWAAEGRPNLWGNVPTVQEMQSEGGAAGAVHGALQSGALATTFTASQGLLLMIPNMYKIAGELTPAVFHVAARSLAAQALSIFGDHSDVMATRSTGFAMLASGSVQEAMDLAAIAHASTLSSRIPFLHFFDGFRTSHEIAKIDPVTREQIRAMIDDEAVKAHQRRGLSPDRPVVRGTAQNPDVFFQGRETVNPFYRDCPALVEEAMERFAACAGRRYKLFDYCGAPDAERLIVAMGSGAEAAHETVDALVEKGERVGLLRVRLFRPFASERFVDAIPRSVRALAVLDRTKEPGSAGEPLYQDAVSAFAEWGLDRGFPKLPLVVGGRFGLGSKEFTPAMVRSIFDELEADQPKRHFTIGIRDDVTATSLEYDPAFSTEDAHSFRALFYGLGSDGTVSANKNSIKIIGENTDHYVQGYFVYDSKKAGSVTVSHLRFGPRPIRSTYLIRDAHFVGCHQFQFLERLDVLESASPKAVFLLNSPHGPDKVWDRLPREAQSRIIELGLRFYVIDAYRVAREAGLGGRINTVMQAAFFALTDVLPTEEALAAIRQSIRETWGKRGEIIVERNLEAVDDALRHLHQVEVPDRATSTLSRRPPVPDGAPDFVRRVTAPMMEGKGDALPVSALPCDGTYPTGTTRWERRNLAAEIPVWDPNICIQCGKCALVCPHAVIRIKVYEPEHLRDAPAEFLSADAKDRGWEGLKYTIQVAPEDCTGCSICVDVCPVKNKSETRLKAINMMPQPPIRSRETDNWEHFLKIPELPRTRIDRQHVRQSQVLQPLFEFSGACAGCGETPYLKLMTQLFGDRAVVANATGCSSIYGGNLPTTPWTTNAEGCGPAWANSLFEDNAEFGLGMRLGLDRFRDESQRLLRGLGDRVGDELTNRILNADQSDEAGIQEQRRDVAELRRRLEEVDSDDAGRLGEIADHLVRKSLWIVGGDGWAYDIGYGGLDHVLASGLDVNILVLDTEVYSNTGGQASKSTPRAAIAKFAASGKRQPKKDLGWMAMSYGQVYVASVAMGAKDEHTLKAFLEAEAFPGPSLIIAYSHCIAHGIDMGTAMQNQKAAVLSGYWPLYRYNPLLEAQGKNPFTLDSKAPRIDFQDFAYRENRFRMLTKTDPEAAKRLLNLARQDAATRREAYEGLANR